MEERSADVIELCMRLMAENYPAIEVLEAKVVQGDGIKTIWRMETSIGPVCLKRLRKTIPIVKFTTAAQAYLAGKGALVAGIIPTKDNELFFVHEGLALVLYEWIDGGDLLMDKNLEHLCTGIKGLAQFYKDNQGFVAPNDCETYNRMGVWPSEYDLMRDELVQWIRGAQKQATLFHQAYLNMTDDMVDMADRAIALLQESCYAQWVESIGDYGYLLHQDYGKGNALATDRGVYILDLDNLAYDIPVRDVRKLIFKRMETLGRWDYDEIVRIMNCFESVFPLTTGQRRILYIDLLYPNKYYGYVKSPFKKGKEGDLEKLERIYHLEMEKLPVVNRLLNENED